MAAGPSANAWTVQPTAGLGPVAQYVIPSIPRDASIVTSRPVVANMQDPLPYPEVLTAGSQLNRPAIAPNGQAPAAPEWPSLSGSQLNRAIFGAPWPYAGAVPAEPSQIGNYKPPFYKFVEIAHHNTPGNYGLFSSIANFLFRHRVFQPSEDLRIVPVRQGSSIATAKTIIPLNLPSVSPGKNEIAGYPGIIQVMPGELLYNNLVPIVYGLRVDNPVAGGSLNSQIQPNFVVGVFNSPVQFTPAGTATLSMKGEVLQ